MRGRNLMKVLPWRRRERAAACRSLNAFAVGRTVGPDAVAKAADLLERHLKLFRER